jgi:phage I-like protein
MTHARQPNARHPHALLLTLGATLDTDTALRSDGTRWDHAAVMGTFYYDGEEFTIDEDVLQSFVANFKRGSPAKVPIDYDHSTTNKKAVGQGTPVPKAGDLVEMKAVTSAADLIDDMLAKIKRAGREPTDPANFGLWIRWRPTPPALGYVKNREYTEMSAAFYEDCKDPKTGEMQGPTLYAVALTNTPFLNDMVSIAASALSTRGGGGDAADPDDLIDVRAQDLLVNDESLAKMAESNPHTALAQAQQRARRELYESWDAFSSEEDGSDDSDNADLDDLIDERANALLSEDKELRAMYATQPHKALSLAQQRAGRELIAATA